ncbi:dihydroneopterin aldolase [Patescibacteria group bacterium]|nr:MAG: dihydroneopterin aldolase [Patescibacteria group bacterium]
MSKIYLKDLVIDAKHGVYDHEKTTEQRFKIDLTLEVDNESAFESDDVSDTIDYAYVRQTVINTVQTTSFNLIERLAQEIADQVLDDKRILAATVAIYKLDAFETGIPGIEITCTQNQS